MNRSFTIELNYILCSVDFGELSSLALKYAAVTNYEYGARLTVLHAQSFVLPSY
jgi:hypothetical protein